MIALVEGAKRGAHAERDRAVDPARDDDDRVPAQRRDAVAVLALRRYRGGSGLGRHGDRARCAAGVPDPDDDRRVAVGDRHRRHGPDGPRERDRDLGPRGRSRWRRRRAAARQDRHDHARRPARDGVSSGAAHRCSRARRRRAARVARRRDAGGRSIVVLAKQQFQLRGRDVSTVRAHVPQVLRADAHERRRRRRPPAAQGRGRRDPASSSKPRAGRGRRPSARSSTRSRAPARRRSSWRRPGTARACSA